MKDHFVLKVLIILAGLFSANILLKANTVFEFDGMPIDISEAEFIKKRPLARLLSQSNEPNKSKTYFYILPTPLIIDGAKATTSARGFESGKGCGIGIGFEISNPNEIAQLTAYLKEQYKKVQDSKPLGEASQIIYLENDDLFASIVLSDAEKDKPAQVNYAVTSKSCGVDLARRWQTSPR